MVQKKNRKFIFVVGGVMSGVGKGIATSAIGKILQAKGFAVNLVKVDPYLNVDAGTMNPTEHGEVFVLKSGLETDQDMGNYERFLDRDLSPNDYITSGMIYQSVIEKERNLGYRGKCVEAIPHIRDEIIGRVERAASANLPARSAQASGSSISVIEIGGTIGDYQNIMFIEAARVMKVQNPDDVVFVVVSYLPIPGQIGEMKTRPTQNAVRMLNSYGVQPDLIIARSEVTLDRKRKEKIAISCNIGVDKVISAPDIESIYEVPINFEKDDIGGKLLEELKLHGKNGKAHLTRWKNFVTKSKNVKKEVHIAVVGKYFDTGDFVLSDVYISVIEAIKFSAWKVGMKPVIHWLNSKEFSSQGGSLSARQAGASGGEGIGKKRLSSLKQYNGIIIPGGFGETGIEGKLNVIRFARENKIPFFGLCYGMQLAVIEFARNVLKIKDAHTTEIDPNSKNPVVLVMPEQKKNIEEDRYGGTMRLGVYPAYLKKGTIARGAYGKEIVEERHRHRYEINPDYVDKLMKAGLVFSGVSPDRVLMEIAELPQKKHPFFLGTQFHPELQARPLSPHPLFTEFIKAACLRAPHRQAVKKRR